MTRHDRRIHLSWAAASARLMSLIAMTAMIASLVAGVLAPAGSASAQPDYPPKPTEQSAEPTYPPVLPNQPYPPIPTYPPVLPIPTYPAIPTVPPKPTEQPVEPIPTYPPKPTEQPVEPTPTYPPKPTEQPVEPTPTYPPKPTEQSVDPTYPPESPADPAKTGSVVIYKYTCPPEVERTSDHETLRDTCLERIEPVEFTLHGTGYARTQMAEGGVPLKTAFLDVPFGTIVINESVPDGYGKPVVFCGYGSDFTEVSVSRNTVRWALDSGSDASADCLFFNVSKEEPLPTATMTTERATTFTIIFTKYYCPEMDSWDRTLFHPPGTPHYTDLYNALVQTCQEPPGTPVTLELTNDGGFSSTVVMDEPIYDSSSTPVAYQAVAEDLPVGRDLPLGGIWINEVPSAGYGDPYIACYGERVDPPQYAAYRNVGEGLRVIALDLEGDDDIVAYCDLFNVPDSGSETVTVSGYVCPLASARDDDQLALEANCLGPGPRIIRFGLTDSLRYNGTHYVDYAGVPATTEFFYTAYGPITITGSAGEGYGEPVAFCSADPESGLPFERIPVTDGTVPWDLDPDDPGDLECRFFFFPEGDPTPTARSSTVSGSPTCAPTRRSGA